MAYTMSEVSEKTGLSPFTIRYYDKEGLIPFVERSQAGRRLFSDADLRRLELVCCLKNTGMSIAEIKKFISWEIEGDEDYALRLEMLEAHRKKVKKKIAVLEKNLSNVDGKIKTFREKSGKQEGKS